MTRADRLSRRTWLAGLLGLAALACERRGAGGQAEHLQCFSAGLFTQLPSMAVPAFARCIKTVGYAIAGRGGATYHLDPDQTSGGASRIRGRSLDGRWFLLSAGPVEITTTGAIGDGQTDDTAAIQAAIDAGRDVVVPSASAFFRISSPIVLRSRSTVRGTGRGSRIVQVGTGDRAAVFFGDGQTGIALSRLSLAPNPDSPAMLHGFGVFLRDCRDVSLRDLHVNGHRRGGIALFNCTNAEVRSCEIGDSVVQLGVRDHTESGYDILVAQGGRNIVVSGNRCIAGAGIGIAVQSFAADSEVRFSNIGIEHNMVERQGCYGILVYRGSAARFGDISVTDNIIAHISGHIPQISLGLVFGAGIYVQGVEDVRIRKNTVRSTNVATARETLAPAGIGVANASSVEIGDNRVSGASWYGICVFDPAGEGRPDGIAKLTRNVVRASGKSGIYGKDIPAIELRENVSTANNEHGFLLQAPTHRRATRATLTGNEIADNRNNGVFFLAGDGRLSGNRINDNLGDGVLLGVAGHFTLSRNMITRNHGFGLTSRAANGSSLSGNTVRANGRGSLNIVA